MTYLIVFVAGMMLGIAVSALIDLFAYPTIDLSDILEK